MLNSQNLAAKAAAGSIPRAPTEPSELVRAGWLARHGRTLAGLPEKTATVAVEFIYGSLAENPRRVGKPLQLGLAGLHSTGRGDYRVINMIDERLRTVTIMAIEHRSDVYRPRAALGHDYQGNR